MLSAAVVVCGSGGGGSKPHLIVDVEISSRICKSFLNCLFLSRLDFVANPMVIKINIQIFCTCFRRWTNCYCAEYLVNFSRETLVFLSLS